MESVGSRLKNLRLEKGLTLQEVSKKTKVHLNILKAIEEDTLVGINLIYIKGFIKIYCKLLGVDPKDYIPDYQEPQGKVKSLELSETKQRPDSNLLRGFLNLGSFRGIRISRKPILIIIAILVSAFLLFNLGKFISSRYSAARKNRKTEAPAIKKMPHSKTATPRKEALSVIRLGLRAKENCWVDLKVDGRTVFHTILKKGKFESWTALDKMELSLGNAGVVELELDGRAIPALGRKGQVIKGIRITKNEGLVVPR